MNKNTLSEAIKDFNEAWQEFCNAIYKEIAPGFIKILDEIKELIEDE